ncbi:MAG: RnfABCDGE type electron transport complex subunit D [Planctomycetota bacterium]
MTPPTLCGLEPERCAGAPVPDDAPRWLTFPYLPLGFTLLLLSAVLLPRVHDNQNLVWAFAGAAAGLLTWIGVLWARTKGDLRSLRVELVPLSRAHYIQGAVQLCVYAYWAQYWPQVYLQIPLILSQLVFFYAFDALLSWSRKQTFRFGCGPLPIILSTNVFLCFKDDWFVFQFVLIACAALGKAFVKWTRDGRTTHVFNPSAFSLALFAVVLLATGTTDLTWGGKIADSFAQPPKIYLLIFVLGLVVQYFFSVTLMTLSAAAMLGLLSLVYFWSTGTYFFIFSNIPAPVFLGLHLLVTDPSTSPRSNAGKVMFGALYGLLTFAFYGLLSSLGQPTIYDKLLPIPILNLSVKWIDRLAQQGVAGTFSRWEAAFQPRKLNWIHMSGWSVLFLWMLSAGFVQGRHPGGTYEFWKRAVDEGKHNAVHGLLEVLKSHARDGSAPAWNELGNLYLEGKLVEKDPTTAARYYAQASKGKSLAGSANLATMYLGSERAGDSKVVTQAFDQLEQACAEPTDGAIYFLVGRAYELGKGRPLDPARARMLFEQGCARGNREACESLGRLK